MSGYRSLELGALHTAVGGRMGTADDRAKRAFDVVISLALLLVAVPLVAVLAVGVVLTLRTTPFFTQIRVGRDGRHFRFVKLRTLPSTAPAYADKYEIGQVRLPAFCRFLRKTHLDELPQLLLVVKGEMSLVGPRPDMPGLHSALASTHRQVREDLRPGCTGIWQVSVDNDRLIGEAPAYDHHYWLNASVRMDVWILWRTLLLVVGARRVALSDVPAWALGSATIDLVDTSALVEPTVDLVPHQARRTDPRVSLGRSAAR